MFIQEFIFSYNVGFITLTVASADVITWDVVPFDIAKAVGAALWKSSFVKDTFVRNRGNFAKYQRLLQGDIAKLALKRWLESRNLKVTDWDDARTDDWRSSRKTYDLRINNHNIEVRTSMSKHSGVGNVLANENIIQPTNVKTKEITIQLFFQDESCSSLWLCGWAWKRDLEDRQLISPRRVGGRLVDFYMMPFSNVNAHTMYDLIQNV